MSFNPQNFFLHRENEGSKQSMNIQLGNKQNSKLGYSNKTDVALYSKVCSKEHCMISFQDDGKMLIKDLDSRNGTFINGNRLEINVDVEANENDLIGFGISTDKIRASKRTHLIYRVKRNNTVIELEDDSDEGDLTIVDFPMETREIPDEPEPQPTNQISNENIALDTGNDVVMAPESLQSKKDGPGTIDNDVANHSAIKEPKISTTAIEDTEPDVDQIPKVSKNVKPKDFSVEETIRRQQKLRHWDRNLIKIISPIPQSSRRRQAKAAPPTFTEINTNPRGPALRKPTEKIKEKLRNIAGPLTPKIVEPKFNRSLKVKISDSRGDFLTAEIPKPPKRKKV